MIAITPDYRNKAEQNIYLIYYTTLAFINLNYFFLLFNMYPIPILDYS